jgi:hypothetical protein
MQDYPDFKLHDKIIPLPNIDKDDFHEKWYEGRNLGDLVHPFKVVCCSPPNAGKTTAIMNIFMRCQLGRKPFETLIVIQPDTSHEYDQLDPTLIITDIPSPEDIVLSKEDMKKTAIIIDDFEMSRLNKIQVANLSKLFRYLSSHNNISIFCGYQDFHSVPIIIRKCATHFIIWRTRNSDEMTLIAKKVGMSKEIIHEIFRREMKSRRDSLLIDLVSPDNLFLRKNIFDILDIDEYKPLKLAKTNKEKKGND